MKNVLTPALLFFFALVLMVPAMAEIIDDDTPVPPVGDWGGPDRVLTDVELEQWIRGRKVFDKDWRQFEGLGTPDMNADSCRACHQQPVIGAGGALDTNVTQFGNDNGGAGPFTELPGGLVATPDSLHVRSVHHRGLPQSRYGAQLRQKSRWHTHLRADGGYPARN